jgi:hypothetical protein
MVAWVFTYDDGHVSCFCDAHGRAQAAKLGARLPEPHEAGTTTRKGTGRSRWSVDLRRAPQRADWADVACGHCDGN